VKERSGVEAETESWALPLLVTQTNGKHVDVVADKSGFRLNDSDSVPNHTLVELLKVFAISPCPIPAL
jgi:hypothetical protein